MELHDIISVSATDETGVYIVQADITDIVGERYICDYCSRSDDTFGLAPKIREAVDAWIANGKAVAPYTPPTTEELRAAMPTLSARQFRLGLVGHGHTLASVQAAIDAIADATEREKAQIEWEYATTFVRTHPLIEQIAAELNMTADQVDTMWMAASKL